MRRYGTGVIGALAAIATAAGAAAPAWAQNQSQPLTSGMICPGDARCPDANVTPSPPPPPEPAATVFLRDGVRVGVICRNADRDIYLPPEAALPVGAACEQRDEGGALLGQGTIAGD